MSYIEFPLLKFDIRVLTSFFAFATIGYVGPLNTNSQIFFSRLPMILSLLH